MIFHKGEEEKHKTA